MGTLLVAATIKYCHWFICRADLDLHKVCPAMLTLGTGGIRLINVLPFILSTKHIVNFLALKLDTGTNFELYRIDVRARLALESLNSLVSH